MDFHQAQMLTAISNFRTILIGLKAALQEHPDDPQLQEAAKETIKFLEEQGQQIREISGQPQSAQIQQDSRR